MKKKIPVFATVARTYRFAFGNIVNNLGAIWIPTALAVAGAYYLMPGYFDALVEAMTSTFDPESSSDRAAAAKAAQANLEALASLAPYVAAILIGSFVFNSAVSAALTKEALGLRKGFAFLSFPFGPAFWRLLGAFALLTLVFIGLYICFFVATVALAFGAGMIAKTSQSVGTGSIVALIVPLGILTIFGALIYVAVRMSFVLTPVVVAERRISLGRGWSLTKGNFWRIVIIVMAILVPILIVDFIYLVWFWPDWLVIIKDPDAIPAGAQNPAVLMKQVADRMQQFWFIVYPFSIIFTLLFFALLIGASAFAYRALVPDESTPDKMEPTPASTR
jgi:hypothetical protein